MTNLVTLKDERVVTTSLQVAETFGKEHKHVMDAIRSVENEISAVQESSDGNKAENPTLLNSMFYKDKYTVDNNHRSYPMYYMNKDGFTLLVMGFTGSKATKFKLQYIAQFNRMEKEVKQPKLSLPQNYAGALRQLAETVEENEKLKIELQQTNFQQEILNNIEKAEQKLEILYTAEEIAGTLGLRSARQLNQLLKESRIAYYQKGLWHLYKPYKNRGFKDMSTRRKSQMWTAKGKEFIEIRLSKPETEA